MLPNLIQRWGLVDRWKPDESRSEVIASDGVIASLVKHRPFPCGCVFFPAFVFHEIGDVGFTSKPQSSSAKGTV